MTTSGRTEATTAAVASRSARSTACTSAPPTGARRWVACSSTPSGAVASRVDPTRPAPPVTRAFTAVPRHGGRSDQLRFVGEAEHTLGDDVALHLGGAPPDGQRGREQEAVAPHPGLTAQRTRGAEHPRRAGEVLGQVHEALTVLIGEDLADRALGAGGAPLDGGADRPQPEQAQQLA